MPAIIELSTVVNTNEGMSKVVISRWAMGESCARSLVEKAVADIPDGRVQRVKKNSARRPRLATARSNENSQDRKTFSPQNLQFTVHFHKNCLENSKARLR